MKYFPIIIFFGFLLNINGQISNPNLYSIHITNAFVSYGGKLPYNNHPNLPIRPGRLSSTRYIYELSIEFIVYGSPENLDQDLIFTLVDAEGNELGNININKDDISLKDLQQFILKYFSGHLLKGGYGKVFIHLPYWSDVLNEWQSIVLADTIVYFRAN